MEIFQKSPKTQASFETAKSALAQMALSSNQYALKVQRLQMILALTTAPKVPEWPSYGNFRKVTQIPHFRKKCKGGPGKIFQKLLKKQPSLKKPISSLAQVALSSNQYALNVQRLEKILAHKAAPKVPEWLSYGNFSQVTQTPIFVKSAKGDQGKFFKNCSKSSPRLKNPQAVSRKWHYPLISTHLTCKQWK